MLGKIKGLVPRTGSGLGRVLRLIVIFGPILIFGESKVGSETDQLALARGLANKNTRDATLRSLGSPAIDRVALLLKWAEAPPKGVDKKELYVGLAECFGRFRTVQAIPFLIDNIDLSSVDFGDTWMKTPEVVEERMSAVRALVIIGKPAETQLIRAFWAPSTFAQRYAILYTVARIGGPGAKGFLFKAKNSAEIERQGAIRWLPLLGPEIHK